MIDTDKILSLLRDQYYAHTTKNANKSDWQLQEIHLKEVSQLCEEFASTIGLGEEGRIAGLLHDIGKYSEKFQSRLEDNSIKGINHWSNGALLAFELGYPLVAFVIQGHHTGLPNMSELGSLMRKMKVPNFYEKITGFKEPHESIINKFVKRGLILPKEFKVGRGYDFSTADFSTALRTRMLFSCLVDADRGNSREFTNSITGKITPFSVEGYPDLQPSEALSILLGEVKSKSSNTILGNLRNQVLNDCLTGASLPSGIFTLTVPTGGAKTISSIAFGLKHAEKYGKKKLIYVLPFTTIIDQTGTVLTEDENDPNKLTLKYNKHFGDDYVLEHHSSLEVDNDHVEKYRIASSNWGNPVIVTTTVQFFESLFSNRTSQCVKLHNIPNSVIVFDEVQTLPTKMLRSLLTAVQILVKDYNCTVLFCSATVPAFESVKLNIPWKPIELCSKPIDLSIILKRVDIKLNYRKKISHGQLARKISKHNQCLIVANTKTDVSTIYEELIKLKGINPEDCFHLSTAMCSKHRKKVIAEIRKRLIDKKPCRVVSTQLIEAGVDVDFPHGFRVLGPLDSIIQVAGRINREGKMVDGNGNPIKGILEVVNLLDGRSPKGSYQTCVGITQSFLAQNSNMDLHSPVTYKEYYKQMYSLVGRDVDPLFVCSENLQFEEAHKQCHVIDDLTVSVIVPYEEGLQYIDMIKTTGEIPKWLYRKLQILSVNVFKNKLSDFIDDEVVFPIECGDSTVYYWKPGLYDEKLGAIYHQLEPKDFIL